jgi:hypothetical protein
MTETSNSFREGDEVIFAPDQRTIGWYQHSFDRWQIFPGYYGKVTKVEGDQVTIDDKSEATMHWSQFRRASEVASSDREQMVPDYKRRVK